MDQLDEAFEQHRTHLRAVAYRMLGSFAEADDAVQDTWVRIHQSGADGVDNIGGWLTTVVARVCLNMLRSRRRRREDPLEFFVPDPVITRESADGPEDQAVLADSVSLALLVVLETLAPAERLAFVLHDLFDMPYDEVARLVERSPDATRQLASRARRRVQGAEVDEGEHDRTRQREVVDAFFAAARGGDIAELVNVLDPEVVLRIDAGAQSVASMALAGSDAVSAQTVRGLASTLSRPHVRLEPVLVNGVPGVVATAHGRPISVIGFVFRDGRIARIDSIAEPDRVAAVLAASADQR